MKLITRDTDYAIRALCCIARKKEKIISVSDLVDELEIPRSFLRKILQILNKERFLESYKGQNGGFRLAFKPDKIFLMDLMEVFQGPFRLNECLFKRRACPQKNKCLLRKRIVLAEKHVVSELEDITLASLLK